jgi:hypothetical protein
MEWSDLGITAIMSMFTSIIDFGKNTYDKIVSWSDLGITAISGAFTIAKDKAVEFYDKQKGWYEDFYKVVENNFKDLTDITDSNWNDKIKKNAEDFFIKINDLFEKLSSFVPGGPLMNWGLQTGQRNVGNVLYGNPNAGVNTGNNLVAAPGGGVGNIPPQWLELIKQSASASGFSPALIAGIIQQESQWNPNAVNKKSGATGLGQFMPGTAKSLGIDPTNPEQSILAIGRYLKDIKAEFKRKGIADPTIEQILAGYNAGPGNVLKYGGQIPPFAETQKYVPAVLRHTAQYGGQGQGGLMGMGSNAMDAVSGWMSQGYESVKSALQTAADAVTKTPYVRGGRNPLQGLDCSGAADFVMVSSLSAFNQRMAEAYKQSVSGVAAGKAQKIAQTFGVPLLGPENFNVGNISKMGAGTVMSYTNTDPSKWYTGHTAVVTEGTGGLVVTEAGKSAGTPLAEWISKNQNKGYYAANPFMAANIPSPATGIQDATLNSISQQANAQQQMITAMENVQKQQAALPPIFTNMTQMVNNNRSGENIATRQVLSPPENIMESQYSLFVLNSTYNE